MPLSRRAFARFIGTFWLVFGGSAVLGGGFPGTGSLSSRRATLGWNGCEVDGRRR
jgi:glycerol uptake facilitator-like aquaporin